MTHCPHCHTPYAAPTAQAVVVHLRACPRAPLTAWVAGLRAAYGELLAENGVEA